MTVELAAAQVLSGQQGSSRNLDQARVSDWVDVLATFPIFSGVRKRQLRELVRAARFEEFAPGETVIAKGETADSMFVIISGSAKVLGRTPGRPLRTGDAFGELALLDGGPRTRTVVAARELHVMRIPAGSFLRLSERYPVVPLTLLSNLTSQFRRVEKQLALSH
jgi:CRP-like cAMP-binding protein